jgi:hypothetical protein
VQGRQLTGRQLWCRRQQSLQHVMLLLLLLQYV